jgi:hypothetical protein
MRYPRGPATARWGMPDCLQQKLRAACPPWSFPEDGQCQNEQLQSQRPPSQTSEGLNSIRTSGAVRFVWKGIAAAAEGGPPSGIPESTPAGNRAVRKTGAVYGSTHGGSCQPAIPMPGPDVGHASGGKRFGSVSCHARMRLRVDRVHDLIPSVPSGSGWGRHRW